MQKLFSLLISLIIIIGIGAYIIAPLLTQDSQNVTPVPTAHSLSPNYPRQKRSHQSSEHIEQSRNITPSQTNASNDSQQQASNTSPPKAQPD